MFKAKLTNMLSLGAEFVEFDYNPKTVSATRQKFSSSQGSPAQTRTGGARESRVSPKPMSLTIDGAILEGEQSKVRADLIMSWLNPGGGLIGMALGAAASALGFENLMKVPPPLLFIWGPPILGFSWIMQMQSCTVKYTRVSSDGIPLRAELNIKLEEMLSLQSLLPQNPTSGGLPGRARHLVTEGDSLANISTQRYGRPAPWRQVAEVNGIDDPFKVRPGQVVYLPSTAELGQGRLA